jgi:hypothetical protein
MIAVIDTNLFYFLVDDKNSKYDSSKILKCLSQEFEHFEISDLSILEMLVAFRNDKNNIKRRLDFIKEKNLYISPLFLPEHNFNGITILSNYENDSYLDKIIKHAYNLKKNMENSYLRFWTCSLASIIVACKSFQQTTKVTQPDYITYLCSIMFNNNKKDGQLGLYYDKVLNDFYESKESFANRQRILKESIINKIFEFSESLYGFTEIEKEGIDFYKIYNPGNSFTINEWDKIFDTFSDSTIIGLEKRKQGLYRNFTASEKENLHNNLRHYEEKLSLSSVIPKGQCSYFRILFERLLLSKNQKIDKNDVIDSMFMIYYPNKQLLTVDERLQGIIKEINESYYQNSITILNKCLKETIN